MVISLVPPEISIATPKVYSSNNRKKGNFLECQIMGEPRPEVYWIGPDNNAIKTDEKNKENHEKMNNKNYILFGPDNNNNYKLLVNTTKDGKHIGKYKCVGENMYGAAEGTVELTGKIYNNYF